MARMEGLAFLVTADRVASALHLESER